MDWYNFWMTAITAFVGLFMLSMILFLGTTIYADNGCKEAGWTRGESTVTLNLYCYSRIDGSDFLIPYDAAIRIGHPRQLWRDE